MSFHFFLWGSHPPRSTPGEHTDLPSHTMQCLFIIQPFNAAFIHTLTHGRWKYGGWVCSDGPHVFFYVHQLHRHNSTHPSLFTSWVALWEPLVCSYDISHSRAWQASITPLAATSVSQIVTHPSTNRAQSCLTSIQSLTI